MRLFSVFVIPVFVVVSAPVLWAQDYPTKPVRLITGASGGGNDFSARVVGQAITGALGQPVVVDNRTVLIATEVVAKSPPDAYSLWLLPLMQKTTYDTDRDFIPVSLLSRETTDRREKTGPDSVREDVNFLLLERIMRCPRECV
jgi:tripartite-type tricarboxylate transporter receptor subunit TctC